MPRTAVPPEFRQSPPPIVTSRGRAAETSRTSRRCSSSARTLSRGDKPATTVNSLLLQVQQLPLQVEATRRGEARQLAATPDDSMARNDDRNLVRGHHRSNRACGIWRADESGQFAVAERLAEANRSRGRENLLLELRPMLRPHADVIKRNRPTVGKLFQFPL